MFKAKYDNEKVIFGATEAKMAITNEYHSALVFYKDRLNLLYQKNKKLRILDVGCGAGALTKAIKKLFAEIDIAGCDISRRAIKEALKNADGVDFLCASACRLPFESGEFDVVIMHSVLDHVENSDASAREVNRVLKKGGTFLLMDPLEKEPNTIHGQLTRRVKSFRMHRRKRCGHITAFGRESLFDLLRNCGFKIKSVELDWFYLAQLIDVLYYPLVSFLGRGPEFTLKKYSGQGKMFSKLVGLSGKLFWFVINIESVLTDNIPIGLLAYVEAKKI